MKRILILLCLPLLFATCKKEEDNTPINNTGNNSTQTYVPDDNFEAYLEANNMGNGIPNDDYVTTANINTVLSLMVINKNISDLTGIADFTALLYLDCTSNQLTTLDVSQNTALTTLYCDNNQLTTLDVSNNTALTSLECQSNQFTSLDVRNGNNTNFINCFCATNNPNLYCIDVDDDAWSTANWMYIDTQSFFSDNCGM